MLQSPNITAVKSSLLIASEKQRLGTPKRQLYLGVWESYVITDFKIDYLTDVVTASQPGSLQLSPVPCSFLPSSTTGSSNSRTIPQPPDRHTKHLKLCSSEKTSNCQCVMPYLSWWHLKPVQTHEDMKWLQIFSPYVPPRVSHQLPFSYPVDSQILPCFILNEAQHFATNPAFEQTKHFSPGSVSSTPIASVCLPEGLSITHCTHSCLQDVHFIHSSWSPTKFLASGRSQNSLLDYLKPIS